MSLCRRRDERIEARAVGVVLAVIQVTGDTQRLRAAGVFVHWVSHDVQVLLAWPFLRGSCG